MKGRKGMCVEGIDSETRGKWADESRSTSCSLPRHTNSASGSPSNSKSSRPVPAVTLFSSFSYHHHNFTMSLVARSTRNLIHQRSAFARAQIGSVRHSSGHGPYHVGRKLCFRRMFLAHNLYPYSTFRSPSRTRTRRWPGPLKSSFSCR